LPHPAAHRHVRNDAALLVANRFGKGLAERDADIFDRVVGIDLQVAPGHDIEVDQSVANDLVKHVVKEGDARIELAPAAAVEIDADADLGFQRIASDVCLPHE
jgi:hypothetical protein